MDRVDASKMEARCGIWSDQTLRVPGYGAAEPITEGLDGHEDGMTVVELDGAEAAGTSFTAEVPLGNLSGRDALLLSAVSEELI
jgi:hypothetical protein